jgi:tripeptide aminopeptidase
MGQFDLARPLVDELKALGLADAVVDEHCHVSATLPGNQKFNPAVGLIAHLDTSPAVSGVDVKPICHEAYDGSPIVLEAGVTIDPEENPELKKYLGDTIITSDGTTLLGADDKAGIAVIMSALEYLAENPSHPRPTILVAFTPDEEIGRGTHTFPLEEFNAEVAYTLDGSFAGEINLETFDAMAIALEFKGVSTHPGKGKGKLVNALRYMARFIDCLPARHSPEQTEKREGFIHPVDCSGDASACTVNLILRDFDKDRVRDFEGQVRALAEQIAEEEPRLEIEMALDHTYPNMYQYLASKPEIELRLKEAVRLAGIEPKVEPIRGGTDGAVLTSRGLPCPNIFAGGMNFHDKREWISTRAMGLSLCTVLNLLTLHTR